jgi:hypothetical protein
MQEENSLLSPPERAPWNKGKLIGAKPPLLARHVWGMEAREVIDLETNWKNRLHTRSPLDLNEN